MLSHMNEIVYEYEHSLFQFMDNKAKIRFIVDHNAINSKWKKYLKTPLSTWKCTYK